jgi:hypothetical protein
LAAATVWDNSDTSQKNNIFFGIYQQANRNEQKATGKN